MFSGRTKGCFESPPYLDQVAKKVSVQYFKNLVSVLVYLFLIFHLKYGETDEGLRRGNPLSLCGDRWNKIATNAIACI